MDLHEIGQEYNKLPQEIRDTIIKFIEHKTNLDMQQVIREIQGLNNRIEKDIQGLNNDIQGLNNRIEKDIQSLEKSNATQIKILYWVFGIGLGLITVFLAIIALRH